MFCGPEDTQQPVMNDFGLRPLPVSFSPRQGGGDSRIEVCPNVQNGQTQRGLMRRLNAWQEAFALMINQILAILDHLNVR